MESAGSGVKQRGMGQGKGVGGRDTREGRLSLKRNQPGFLKEKNKLRNDTSSEPLEAVAKKLQPRVAKSLSAADP